jgi:hypothetical protein
VRALERRLAGEPRQLAHHPDEAHRR